MIGVSACPDLQVLERLVLGQLLTADTQSIEDHVRQCPRCAERLEQVRGEDPLVEALRTTTPPDAVQTDLVRELIPSLKRLRPPNMNQTMSDTSLIREPTSIIGTIQTQFDFLAPAQCADEIGRLGSWRVLRVLGAGGMGVVFLADDPRLKRQIALKVIKPELVKSAEVRERFLREAQSIAAIEHENIVTVFHVEEDRGVPLLAMPLLRGESLEERIGRAGGPLPVDEVLRIGREIASGLAAAHDRGLIHRDIKPGNIFLATLGGGTTEPAPESRDPESGELNAPAPPFRVKILDFGLVQAIRGENADLPHEGSIMGTPAYMAPEQARGQPTDARADLFSLGCVLYRMATGRPSFSGTELIGLLLSVATDVPPCPRELNPELPQALSDLIEKLLAKSAEQRPASAQAVVEVIEEIERLRDEATRPRPSRRGLWILTATALLAVGVATWLALNRPEPEPELPSLPGEVTFEASELTEPFIIQRGEDESQTIDPKANNLTFSLSAGTYKVWPRTEKPGQRLRPELLEVKAGDSAKVAMHLVGELNRVVDNTTIWSVALSPRKADWTVLAASDDGTVGIWNAAGGDELKFFRDHEAPVRSVAISPDGATAASGGGRKGGGRVNDTSIRLWNVQTRAPIGSIEGHRTWVQALAFSPDGKKLLSGDNAGKVYLWDVKTREQQGELVGHNGLGVYSAAFSPDGALAVTGGGDRKVIVWDVAQSKLLQRLEGHTEEVRGVAFGPGTGQVASAGMDGSIRIWDWKKNTVVRSLGSKTDKAHEKRGLRCLALTRDGKRLVSGGEDGVVRIWEAETGTQLEHFEGHKGDVYSVAFSADGRRVVSGGSDHTVRLWGVPR